MEELREIAFDAEDEDDSSVCKNEVSGSDLEDEEINTEDENTVPTPETDNPATAD